MKTQFSTFNYFLTGAGAIGVLLQFVIGFELDLESVTPNNFVIFAVACKDPPSNV